jgi:hypothetical protein
MTEVYGGVAPQQIKSLIEQTPPHAGPSALTLVQQVDRELCALESYEVEIGRSTRHTRWQREQLLCRREAMARMVN